MKRLTDVLKKKFKSTKFMKRILNQSIQIIIIRDLINAFSMLIKMLHKKISSKICRINKISNAQMNDKSRKEFQTRKINLFRIENMIISHEIDANFYIVQISKIRIKINKIRKIDLLNIEIEINLMNVNVARKCELSIHEHSIMHIIDVTNHKMSFLKITKNVKIDIDEITITIHFFVVNNLNHVLIFECSFVRKTHVKFEYFNDKSCEVVLYFENDEKQVNVKMSTSYHARIQTEVHLFSKKLLN